MEKTPAPRRRGMKLYIWDDFLPDYSSGLAVAVAPDVRSARRAVLAAYGSDPYGSAAQSLKAQPAIVPITDDMPAQAWRVCGGS